MEQDKHALSHHNSAIDQALTTARAELTAQTQVISENQRLLEHVQALQRTVSEQSTAVQTLQAQLHTAQSEAEQSRQQMAARDVQEQRREVTRLICTFCSLFFAADPYMFARCVM